MAADNRGPEFTAVIGVFLGISWIFAILRLYVRTIMTKNFSVDDYFFIVAMVMFTTYCSTALTGIKYGTGRHIWTISATDLPRALYFWWLCEIFYNLCTVALRLSVAFLLRRLCVNKKQLWVIYICASMVTVFSIFYLIIIIVQCSPPSYFWGQYEGQTGGKCLNTWVVVNSSMAHSVILAFTDWVLGLVPIFMLWSLQMNKRAKFTVGGVLSLGMIAGIGAIIRIPFLHTLATTSDFLYATTDVAIWSTIEPALGIIAAASATLRPLFRTFFDRTGRSTGHAIQSTGKSRPKYFKSSSRDTELNELSQNKNNVMRRTEITITYKDAKDNWSMSEERLNGSSDLERDAIHDGQQRRQIADDSHSYDSAEKKAPRQWPNVDR